MKPTDSNDLLREYIRTRSEEAFRMLVVRHSPVVYGTALRRLNGNRTAAQDISQEVFSLLARKADRLEGMVLGAWLFRQTCRHAANHARSETRRRGRESTAMEIMNISTPENPSSSVPARELDAALLALPEKDRDALVLRFFEGKEFKRVGMILGLGEEAARKRVTRALERLEGHLRKKGITCSTALLGQTISGYGKTEVPAGLANELAEKAFRAHALTGTAALTAMVWPVVLGVAATSAVMIPVKWIPEVQSPQTASVLKGGASGRSRNHDPVQAKELSLDQILTELKRVRSKPGNSLTAMQLEHLMEQIETGKISAFLEISKGRLAPDELADIHTRLFNRWLAADPKSAMDHLIATGSGEEVNSWSGSNLVNNLFDIWVLKDRSGAESWLLENWAHPELMKSAFDDSLRAHLSMEITDSRFANEGVSSVFEFIHRLPSEEARLGALRGLAGENPWLGSWSRGSPEKWEAFHQALKTLPDTPARRDIGRKFWTALGSGFPDQVSKMREKMAPEDQFLVSLGWLGVTNTPGERTPTLGGGYLQKSVAVSDREERQAAALEAGIRAGLAPEQALQEIARVLFTITPPTDFLKWLDDQPGSLNLDDLLSDKAISIANMPGWSQGDEMLAVEWARRIRDEPLRLQLCRAAFRKALMKTPEAALSYLDHTDLPSEISRELRGASGKTQ